MDYLVRHQKILHRKKYSKVQRTQKTGQRKKKYTAALKLGTEYLEKIPNHHNVLFIVGRIHYMKNKYKIAVSYFDRSLEIDSHDIDVLLLKAYSHQKLGENKRVIQFCEKILEIVPKNKAVSELLE